MENMNIYVQEDGTIGAYGTAVEGNITINNELLPEDFRANCFWKYRWNGQGFEKRRAVINEAGEVEVFTFAPDGVECSYDVFTNPGGWRYVNGQWVELPPPVEDELGLTELED